MRDDKGEMLVMKECGGVLTKSTRNGDEVLACWWSLHDSNLCRHLLTILVLTVRRRGQRFSDKNLGVTGIWWLHRHDINHADASWGRRLKDNFLLNTNYATLNENLQSHFIVATHLTQVHMMHLCDDRRYLRGSLAIRFVAVGAGRGGRIICVCIVIRHWSHCYEVPRRC